MTETTQQAAQIDWAGLVLGIISFLGVATAVLQNWLNSRKIDGNTKITHEAKAAAEQIQTATVDRLDYDRLRRMEAALQTLEACEPCRAAILALTDRRRAYAPVSEPIAPEGDL